jgi:hypothetical protein
MAQEQHIDNYKRVQYQVDQLKEKYDQDRIDLIRSKFPEIVDDAQTFLEAIYQRQGSFYEPWEYFQVGEEDGDPERIQAKYNISYQRHRPSRENISPQTDLFLEVSQIFSQRKMKELRENQP